MAPGASASRHNSRFCGAPTAAAIEQVAVRDGDFTAALAIMPSPDFVMLSRRALHLSNSLRHRELAEANAGALILDLGRHTAEGIRESALGAMTNDPADLELWRRLMARARRSMHSGAIITNPVTGASAVNRSHRYTGEVSAATEYSPRAAI